MKILSGQIKRWSFKQRLFEIQRRLKLLDERLVGEHDLAEPELGESLQIVDYWMKNMSGAVEKPKKKRTKPVNLWT